jgi:hypothetical protein
VSLHDGVFEAVRLRNGDRIRSPFLYELRQQMTGASPDVSGAAGLSTLEDQRLNIVLQQLHEDFVSAQVVHLGVVRGFNIARWKRLFFGIRQAVGQVDVTAEEQALHARYSPDDLILGPSREEVERRIGTIEDRLPGAQAGPVVSSTSPVLVGSHRGFNIVLFGRKIYGLRQSLGPIDLASDPDLQRQFRPEDFLVGESVKVLLAEIDNMRTTP